MKKSTKTKKKKVSAPKSKASKAKAAKKKPAAKAKKVAKKKVVKAKSKMKLCNHLFKFGEMVTMTNNKLVPLKVGLAKDTKSKDIVWFILLPGKTVTLNPMFLGNIKFNYVMCMNEDMNDSGNITFVIHHM